MKSGNMRIWVILAVIAAAGFGIYPTIVWSRMSPEAIAKDPPRAEYFRSKSINLGLDLQGGIHLVLGIKTDKLMQNILVTVNRRIPKIFKERGISVTENKIVGDGIEFEVNPSAQTERSKDIEEALSIVGYLKSPDYRVDPAKPNRVIVRAIIDREAFDREVKEATGRALEIIRNRIDAFGVSEPSIQQSGNNKIVVELPGAADPERARNLIGRTAQLEFHRVKEDADLNKILTDIDGTTGGELLKIVKVNQLKEGYFDIHILPENKERFIELISSPLAQQKVPDGSRIYIGSVNERRTGEKIIPIYMLEAEPAMTGEHLEMARISMDEKNKPIVAFEFGSEGAEQFGQLTAELMRGQKRLAIVLDDVVQSAPTVRSQIRARGQIEGDFTHEEARDLAVVLRSGALPAPVEILEDRTVGPSLGKDSIQKGVLASGIGLVLIILFMPLWYKVAGTIADICLFLTILFMLATLALFGATLTLPGIAGIALTLGMAVDANILIFERIKEELRNGKGIFTAVNAGYEKAFTTILDSNLTTLITAGALYEYGTGPIRGFAVTLSIGIVASMFTAIYVSKTIMNKFVLAAKEPRLSI
ncbi:TPA: protein translocase subunit SecD [bacterium]|nr:protein translocase subunit SecD [bacterium]